MTVGKEDLVRSAQHLPDQLVLQPPAGQVRDDVAGDVGGDSPKDSVDESELIAKQPAPIEGVVGSGEEDKAGGEAAEEVIDSERDTAHHRDHGEVYIHLF